MELQTLNNQIGEINEEATKYLLLNYTEIVCGQSISDKTRERYMNDAELFIDFVSRYGIHKYTLKGYREELEKNASIVTSTKKGRLGIAMRLMKRLFDRGVVGQNLASEVRNFRALQEHKKQGLNKEDVDKIEEYFSMMSDFQEIEYERKGVKQIKKMKTHKSRRYLIFCLMTYQGLRTFEVCELGYDSINFIDKTAKVRSKHKDDKETIFLHDKTIRAINSYINDYNIKSGLLIPSRQGKLLSTSSIRYIFNDKRDGIFKELNIERSCHGCRHYFITSLLKKFNDMSIVMRLARLATLETVKVYDDRIKLDGYLGDFQDMF